MYGILMQDAALRPFEKDINLRMENYYATRRSTVPRTSTRSTATSPRFTPPRRRNSTGRPSR